MKSSRHTARYRTKPSVPAQWLYDSGLIKTPSLDFGCGRGTDAKAFGMAMFDPYWFPAYWLFEFTYNTILCTYVLNVMDESLRDETIGAVYRLLKPEGTAYFTVRRDIKEKKTGRGAVQYPVYLNLETVKKERFFEIYVLEKE